MKSVVIFIQNRNFFGAQITHIPLLVALRNKYINSKIIIFSKHNVSLILKELGYCDEVIIEKDIFQLSKEYKKSQADLTILLRKSSLSLSLIIGLLNFQKKIGFENFVNNLLFTETKKSLTNIYRAYNYLLLCRLEYNLISKKKRDVVTIIPGAGGKFKIWNIENYIKIAKIIHQNYGIEVEFILGKEEEELLKILEDVFVIHYNKPVTELASLIYSSSLVIANDCGPSHFAQISDVKTIILYSDEKNDAEKVIEEWFNKKDNKYYLIGERGKSINSINVFEIESLIEKVLSND